MTQEEAARAMAEAAVLAYFVAPGDDAVAVRTVVAQAGVERGRAERFVSAGRADFVRHAARLQADADLAGSGVLAERVAAFTAALHRVVVLGQRADTGQGRRTPAHLCGSTTCSSARTASGWPGRRLAQPRPTRPPGRPAATSPPEGAGWLGAAVAQAGDVGDAGERLERLAPRTTACGCGPRGARPRSSTATPASWRGRSCSSGRSSTALDWRAAGACQSASAHHYPRAPAPGGRS